MEARLDAPATFPAKSNHRFPLRSCCECGETFAPANLEAEFCGERCRKVFNNRRMQRGAEIYDLIMALRYDRIMRRPPTDGASRLAVPLPPSNGKFAAIHIKFDEFSRLLINAFAMMRFGLRECPLYRWPSLTL